MNDKTKPAVFARDAVALIHKGKVEQALALLTEGVARYPRYAAGYQILGDLYARMGDSGHSIEMYEHAFSIDPQNPRLLFALGRQHLATDPDRAQDLFWRALRYEPDLPELTESLKNAIAAMSALAQTPSVKMRIDPTDVHAGMTEPDPSFIHAPQAPEPSPLSPEDFDFSYIDQPEPAKKSVKPDDHGQYGPELTAQPSLSRSQTAQDDDLNLSEITRSALSELTTSEEIKTSAPEFINEDWAADLMAPPETAAVSTDASSTTDNDIDLSFLIGGKAEKTAEIKDIKPSKEETAISDDAAIDALLARYETDREELPDILGSAPASTTIPESVRVTQPLSTFQEEPVAPEPVESIIGGQDSYAALLSELEQSLDTSRSDDSSHMPAEFAHETLASIPSDASDFVASELNNSAKQPAVTDGSSAIADEIGSTSPVGEPNIPEPASPERTLGDITGDLSSFFAEDDTDTQVPDMTPFDKKAVPDREPTSYSKLLDDIDFSSIETPDHDAGILEIGAEEMDGLQFNAASHDELEEPVLSEEERAELSSLHDILTDRDDTSVSEESIQVTEDTGMLPGSLSAEELASLNATGSEESEDDLIAREADEGIDYSDILYGADTHPAITATPEATPIGAGGTGLGENIASISANEPGLEQNETENDQAAIDELAVYTLSPEEEKALIKDAPSDVDKETMPTETAVIDFDNLLEHDDDEPEDTATEPSDDTTAIIGRMMQDSLNMTHISDSEENEKIDQSSLDSLINDYVHALEVFSPTGAKGVPHPSDLKPEQKKPAISNLTEKTPTALNSGTDEESDDSFEPDDLPIDRDEATATMAEIFVKQGLFSRAISIYSSIAKKQPGDQRIQTRLAELKNLRDSASGLV